MASKHVLYRLYDNGGRLLYVGRTENLRRRMSEHRALQPWAAEIDRVTRTPCASYSAACLAERQAIESEHPIHNNPMKGSWERRLERREARHAIGERCDDGLCRSCGAAVG